MAIELITGHAGTAHISSADDGAYNAGTAGAGRYILQTANQLVATMADANTCTIATGDALFDGRHVRLTSPESVTIDSGTQGQQRHDIVGIAYTISGGMESAALSVIKGTPAASAVDPDLPTGNILEGASSAFMPLYRIPLDGISVSDPVLMADALPTIDAITQVQADVEALEKVASYTHNIVGALGSTPVPMYLVRTGSIVTAFVTWTVNPSSANAQISCGTIPSGYRPAYNAAQGGPSVINNSVASGVQYRWKIASNGAVTFISGATGQRECPLALTYYTNDAFPG